MIDLNLDTLLLIHYDCSYCADTLYIHTVVQEGEREREREQRAATTQLTAERAQRTHVAAGVTCAQ